MMNIRLKPEFLDFYAAPARSMPLPAAEQRVSRALARWQFASEAQAKEACEYFQASYPDHWPPETFWMSASSQAFKDFFVWGHDHDFGFGIARKGAMSTRHREITAEALS
ncbi:MAG: hypothetical protein ACAI44_02860, partial [Candidatus Sericytochromatia bacterium]